MIHDHCQVHGLLYEIVLIHADMHNWCEFRKPRCNPSPSDYNQGDCHEIRVYIYMGHTSMRLWETIVMHEVSIPAYSAGVHVQSLR